MKSYREFLLSLFRTHLTVLVTQGIHRRGAVPHSIANEILRDT